VNDGKKYAHGGKTGAQNEQTPEKLYILNGKKYNTAYAELNEQKEKKNAAYRVPHVQKFMMNMRIVR
jgi:hypothetical protein